MNRRTTTIKRQYLAQIIDRTKKIEHRKLKEYWTQRLATVTVPFEMRLINGMSKRAPEVIVRIEPLLLRNLRQANRPLRTPLSKGMRILRSLHYCRRR